MEGPPFWPFGSQAPSAFARVSHVSIHRQHLSCLGFFLPGVSHLKHQIHFLFTLGFIVNLAHLALVPSQVILYLGAMIDNSMEDSISFSAARLQTILHAAQELLCLSQLLARCFCKVTGLLAPCHSLVPLCMFHLCSVLILLRDHFNIRVDKPAKLNPLSSPVVQSSLVCWSQ